MSVNIHLNNAQEPANITKAYLADENSNSLTLIKKLPITIAPQQNIENEYYEINITDDIIDSDSSSVAKLSAVKDGIIPSIIGKIADEFDEDTKDGQIGNTKQRATGDCWLLSGINALSYTEEGREIIKNSLEYEDGYTIVHLKGIGTYVIEDEELALVKSQLFGSKQYSEGDDDMLIFELAIEKALDDIANGNIALDPDAPWWMAGQDELSATEQGGESSTEGGWGLELMYLVTGKTGNRYSSKEEMEKALLEYEKNGNKDIAMSASAHEKGTALDINGNKVRIGAPHAYAIKEVKDGIVTLTNPWDSGKEIQFTMEVFLETFSGVETLDLSENNPKQNLISKEYRFDKDGNKIFIFHDNDRDDYANTREVKYSPEGKPAEITTTQNGRLISKEIYDPNTNDLTKKITYGETGIVQMNYDPETQETTYSFIANDQYGKIKKSMNDRLNLNEAEYNKLVSSNILNYSQFSIKDIENLLKLSDKNWSEAMDYLNKNPDASYKDIENYLTKNKEIQNSIKSILGSFSKNS